MGKYLADRTGCSPAVANAIEQHYLPAGQEDPVPNDSISLLVGIADRINHLAGMMGSGEKPSGSRDPHALRRAATGLVRILVERELEIDLPLLTQMAEDAYSDQGIDLVVNEEDPDQLHTVLLDYIRREIPVICGHIRLSGVGCQVLHAWAVTSQSHGHDVTYQGCGHFHQQ